MPAGVAPRCWAVLRSSGASRPHRYGQPSTAKPAGYEFTERMLHQQQAKVPSYPFVTSFSNTSC